jgi:hypothetical protein
MEALAKKAIGGDSEAEKQLFEKCTNTPFSSSS